jgi:hypothetical protein
LRLFAMIAILLADLPWIVLALMSLYLAASLEKGTIKAKKLQDPAKRAKNVRSIRIAAVALIVLGVIHMVYRLSYR